MNSTVMKLVEQWIAELIEETNSSAEAKEVAMYIYGYFDGKEDQEELSGEQD